MTTAVQVTSGATRASNRRRDIQGLRALAVVSVVLFHAGLPVPGGFVGVDIFFVISGFVITAMLMREWQATGRVAFRRFYARRFRRLMPALAVVVSLTMVASFFILSPLGPQEVAAKTAIGAMLFVSNFVIASTTGGYFDGPAETNPLLNTWSLSIEEQFYFTFPALLALSWWVTIRVKNRRSLSGAPRPFRSAWSLGTVAAVCLASFALALSLDGAGGLGFYSPFTRAWEFAIGALLALTGLAVRSVRSATTMAAGGLVMCLASLWLVNDATPWPSLWTLLPVVGTALLILGGSREDNPISRILGSRGAVAIGDRSYSIYLWHWPVIVFAAAIWGPQTWVLALAAFLSLGPAALSYSLVEEPIRVSRRRPVLFAVATWTIPLALASLLWLYSEQGLGSGQVAAYQAATSSRSAADINGCDQGVPASDLPSSCRWNTGSAGRPIVLLGDSNAAHFSEALIEASDELDRSLVIAAATGCPFLDTDFTQSAFSGKQQKQCQRYIQNTLEWLRSQPPSTVVLASSDRIVASGGFTFLPSGARGNSPEGQETFREALVETVRQIQRAGHTVVLVQVVPHWSGRGGMPEWDPSDCSITDIESDRCTASAPVALAIQSSSVSRAALQAAASATGAVILDLIDRMCPNGTCSTMQGDQFAYRDGSHISPQMSRLLADEFKAALS